jgi:hypothetical protein
MQDSRVIEVDGVFLAAAVALPDDRGWRIVAADARMGRLDGTVAPSLQDVRRLARLAYQCARGVPMLAVAE